MNEYTFDSISIGTHESFKVKITDDMQKSFMNISGDVNPMHLNQRYAESNGFDDKLVYGMLTASFYSTLVGVYLPGKYCLLHECDSSFTKPVYIGDELTVYGEVVDLHEGFKRVTIKAHITNQDGKKVSKAKIIVGIIGDEKNG